MFRVSLFFLKIFATLLTMQCPKCLFHMDNHIDQVKCVTFVEKVYRLNSASKNIYKKASYFFGPPLKDIKISYISYKIQNFHGSPWASIFATCLIKLLMTGFFFFFLNIGPLFLFTKKKLMRPVENLEQYGKDAFRPYLSLGTFRKI